MNMTVFEARKWASSFLKEHKREAGVADILLKFLLNVPTHEWLLIQRDALDDAVWQTFEAWIKEHVRTGKPVEHFTNEVTFFDRTFYVNEHVLIPRPETEELIVAIKDEIRDDDVIADLGTGSGIIAVTLKKEVPDAAVYATDISTEALKIAAKNARNLQAEVTFFQGDFLEPIIDEKIAPTIIVSNPPYIAETESLSDTVLHDPKEALFAKNNGLFAYEKIVNQLNLLPKKPRLIALEIGFDQGAALTELITGKVEGAAVTVLQDINGKDRIVLWRND